MLDSKLVACVLQCHRAVRRASSLCCVTCSLLTCACVPRGRPYMFSVARWAANAARARGRPAWRERAHPNGPPSTHLQSAEGGQVAGSGIVGSERGGQGGSCPLPPPRNSDSGRDGIRVSTTADHALSSAANLQKLRACRRRSWLCKYMFLDYINHII